jgi:cysteine desulfurase/selenocysteine lyase
LNAATGIDGGWAFPARLGDPSLFPDLEYRAYFNHAAISPPSTAVRHAVNVVLDDYARRGVSSFPTWADQRRRLKGKLGKLIGAGADDFGFTLSTTTGVVTVALCFPWKRGDRIVCFEGEFPANVTPWQNAASLFGLEVVMLPVSDFAGSGPPDLGRLQAELERGARLVAVSAVEFQSGLRLPIRAIAELAHRYGAEVFVDAVQACGAVPIDAGDAGVDYLACGSHKWMMGLEGAGFLYIRPDRIEALRPSVAGWLSHEQGLDFLFKGPGHLRYDRPVRRKADFIEAGNVNAAGFAAMEASLDCIQSIGVEAIYDHVNGMLDTLETALAARGFESLRSRDPARRSCTLSALPPAGLPVVELHREMTALGVSCSIPDGVVRFSPHWHNHPDQVAEVIQVLDRSVAAVRGA